MVLENELLAGCGEYCGLCVSYLGEKTPRCGGCNATKGHPFWGKCELYSCVKNHGVNHCGLCEEYPCSKHVNSFDPSNPQGQRNAIVRVGVLAYRAKYGDNDTITLLKKMGKPPRA
jgi:hypothetical protein